MKLGVIDEVIQEPLGGAHRAPEQAAKNIKAAIKKYLDQLRPIPEDKLIELRYEKFRKMGVFSEG